MTLDTIRQEIAQLVEKYAQEAYKPKPFEGGLLLYRLQVRY